MLWYLVNKKSGKITQLSQKLKEVRVLRALQQIRKEVIAGDESRPGRHRSAHDDRDRFWLEI